jgi:hypothetical protein
MIISSRKQNGHVVGTEVMRKTYKFYVRKLEAKRRLLLEFVLVSILGSFIPFVV